MHALLTEANTATTIADFIVVSVVDMCYCISIGKAKVVPCYAFHFFS